MADTADLKRRFRRRAGTVHAEAVGIMGRKLDDDVPIGPPRQNGGPKLKDDQSIRILDLPPIYIGQIEYTVPQAEFTNEGTPPHRIEGAPLLAFFWPKAGRTVILRHVNHPGTDGTRWFDKVMTQTNWGQSLAEAAERTNLPS